jgi:hypothetical protein
MPTHQPILQPTHAISPSVVAPLLTDLIPSLFQVLANCVSGLYCSAIGAAFPQSPGAACLLGVVTMLVSITLSGLNLNHETLPQGLQWLPKLSFCS